MALSAFYPNDLDIYGFRPVEAATENGDYVVDKYTGVVGRVIYVGGVKGVRAGGSFYTISEEGQEK